MEGEASTERCEKCLAPRPNQCGEAPEQVRAACGEKQAQGATYRGLLDMSDEVLLYILDLLDPLSLLCVGGVCTALYRVSATDSLWAKHCQVGDFVPISSHCNG